MKIFEWFCRVYMAIAIIIALIIAGIILFPVIILDFLLEDK
jgi:hypothetical protein